MKKTVKKNDQSYCIHPGFSIFVNLTVPIEISGLFIEVEFQVILYTENNKLLIDSVELVDFNKLIIDGGTLIISDYKKRKEFFEVYKNNGYDIEKCICVKAEEFVKNLSIQELTANFKESDLKSFL